MTKPAITQSELEDYLWGAATLLRGYIDAGDYKQFIFPLLFFKRLCDVYDEEVEQAEADHGIVFREDHWLELEIPEGARWRDVRQQATNVGMAIQSAMRTIESTNQGLFGIFGDAPWTNKQRLSDGTLRDLIEHFSTQTLSLSRVSEDMLGQAYEYLIKKFADDSGHTAAEFYTNRTVVQLMTRLLEPRPGESVYDPTCGSGGMLLATAMELRRQGKEYRNLRLYGQEVNLMTSAMARMNLFMHGFEDFEVIRGNTLANPHFIRDDELRQFDIVLANPPYSIKQWDRDAWVSDPYGRNFLGVPPQGRADYSFLQHILKSLKPMSGRAAVLFPHGVLFREEEREMRTRLIEDFDLVECVVGLGPNLFYNSPMEACIMICRRNKDSRRQNHILFINAIDRVTRRQAQSFLESDHIDAIVQAYRAFEDVEGFAKVVHVDDILKNSGSLSIQLYVRSTKANNGDEKPLEVVIEDWQRSSMQLRESMNDLFTKLDQPARKRRRRASSNGLPPEYAIGEMQRLAGQIASLAGLYATPQQQLDQTLSVFASQMYDLQLITNPMQGLLDGLIATIPKLDVASMIGTAGIYTPPLESLINMLGETVDHAALISAIQPDFSQQTILAEMAKTTSLIGSNAFKSIQDSLGIGFGFDASARNFLGSLTLDTGAQLRGIIGNIDHWNITVDVISDEADFEDLPTEIQENVKEVRRFTYDHGITITVVMIWIVNCLWLLRDRDFEAASALTNTLLALLILLKEMANKEEKGK